MLALALTLASGLVHAQINPADLPTRCPMNEDSLSEDDFGWDDFMKANRAKFKEADKDLFIIDLVLGGDVRSSPLPAVMSFMKEEEDYYARRKELQDKIEKRIAATKYPSGAARAKAYGNYAMTMLYLGEFQKVIDFFGPRSKLYNELDFEEDATVTFALSQAYWRLHQYPDAHRFAVIAFDLNDQLDSRWQLMLADVGLYGKDFIAKHDDHKYSTKYIE